MCMQGKCAGKTDAVHHALTLLYSFRRCWAEVMAPSTDCLFTRLLMFDAVPNSSPSIFWTRETWTNTPKQVEQLVSDAGKPAEHMSNVPDPLEA